MQIVIITLLTLMSNVHCAKILGVFQSPARSHYAIGVSLMKELARRGHNVTFISAYAQKTPVQNFRDVELTGLLEQVEKMRKDMNLFEREEKSPLLMIFMSGAIGSLLTENALNHENVQKLLNSNETFDLVIKEQFLDDALHGLAYHFKSPVLVLSTLGPALWTNRLIANPAPPSYVVDVLLNYAPKMTFLQRTWNTLVRLCHELYTHLYFLPAQNKILHKYFPNAPYITDLMYNTSFVLLNSHVSFDSAVPSVPNMAYIGGFHVEPPKKLPQDLQQFLDEAKEGFIYFSMGSNLQSKDLPPQKRGVILKALSDLKLKVLWKWEDDKLPGQPPNVKIQKWFPQQDILAHPNIKAFITHGGLLSTIEAIYHGVPVVGIPIFGDQKMNIANAERNGYGLFVPYQELSEQSLGAALNEIIRNPKYSENARMRSQIFHDQAMKPMDTAVYWTEYVIKHKGAPHLRSAAMDLTWYQYLLIDVIAFLTLILFIIVELVYLVFKHLLCRKKMLKEKTN